MSLRKSSLALTIAFLASFAFAPAARAQDEKTLNKVGTELARFNKPGGLYAYLKTNYPKFFEIADQIGLAEVLDGSMDAAAFNAAFRKMVANYGLTPEEKTAIRADANVFKKILVTLNAERSQPRLGLSAEEIRNGDVVPALRKNLFDAKTSWLTENWGDTKVKSVGVKFVPGKLVWFNSNISIPELGIKAGVPLTDAQKQAVADLFSFQTAPGDASPDGTAAFPEYVGRAINPNSHVITVINDKGEVISDLVAKGGGPNVPNASRDGRLDYSEALMDSELSRNLGKAGVKNYDSIAVIQPDGLAGKAITIRAPRSMLRHMDMDKLDDAELKTTLERVTHEIAIREGLPSLSIGDWLKTYLPRLSGENWGLLSGLGVEHGSDYTRDNHALAETVDWGWVKLNDGGTTDQSAGEWKNIVQTIERVNKILPDAEKVVVDDAKKIFDAGFQKGQTEGKAERVRFDPKILDEMSDSDLRTLAGGTLDPADAAKTRLSYSATKADVVTRMNASGHTVEMFDYARLVGLPLSQLTALAEHNGITIPKGSTDRAEIIAALTGKHADTVRPELTTATPVKLSETDGFSTALRGLLDARAADAVRVDPVDRGR